MLTTTASTGRHLSTDCLLQVRAHLRGMHDALAIDCPHCGAEIYDDAERCPECAKCLSDEEAPAKLPPLWILIGVAVCILIVVAWMLGG